MKKGLLLVRNRKKKGEVENHKEKMKELWDTPKKSNIQIIGQSGGRATGRRHRKPPQAKE